MECGGKACRPPHRLPRTRSVPGALRAPVPRRHGARGAGFEPHSIRPGSWPVSRSFLTTPLFMNRADFEAPGGAIRHRQSRPHRRPMAQAQPNRPDSGRASGAAIPFPLCTPWLAPWASVLSALRAFRGAGKRMGNGESGMGFLGRCPMPNAQCSMPNDPREGVTATLLQVHGPSTGHS